MISFPELLFAAAFGLLVWFWLDGVRALEIARLAGKRACLSAGVQFLDDTVAATALNFRRDALGRMTLQRTYRFEFSDTGDNRLEGHLILLGKRVESIDMEPHRFPSGLENP